MGYLILKICMPKAVYLVDEILLSVRCVYHAFRIGAIRESTNKKFAILCNSSPKVSKVFILKYCAHFHQFNYAGVSRSPF